MKDEYRAEIIFRFLRIKSRLEAAAEAAPFPSPPVSEKIENRALL
jgi:hypothetical protein